MKAALVSNTARPHERSFTVGSSECRIRPLIEEQLHNRLGALLRGKVERGAALGALRVERGGV